MSQQYGKGGNFLTGAIIVGFLLLAIYMIATEGNSGFSGVTHSPSEVSAPEATKEQFPIPIGVGAEKTEFTAADVVKLSQEDKASMGEVYQWGTRGTLYFFGSTSQVKGMQYEGTGFIVKISDESISIFPTSTKMRVSSIMALDAEQNIIEATSRSSFSEGGVIISSLKGLLGNTKYIIIGFEPT